MEPTKSFDTPEAKLHFLDYWRIIRVRKTVILAVFILVVLTTTLVTFILPATYASTARIAVQKDASDVGGISQGMNAYQSFNTYDPYFMQTEFEKIQSKSILHQVVTNLDLQTVWGERYKQGVLRPEDAMRMLKGSISINQTRNTTLIEIKAFSEDVNEAPTIANKIAEVYRE